VSHVQVRRLASPELQDQHVVGERKERQRDSDTPRSNEHRRPQAQTVDKPSFVCLSWEVSFSRERTRASMGATMPRSFPFCVASSCTVKDVKQKTKGKSRLQDDQPGENHMDVTRTVASVCSNDSWASRAAAEAAVSPCCMLSRRAANSCSYVITWASIADVCKVAYMR
jgi:hypothetical protein